MSTSKKIEKHFVVRCKVMYHNFGGDVKLRLAGFAGVDIILNPVDSPKICADFTPIVHQYNAEPVNGDLYVDVYMSVDVPSSEDDLEHAFILEIMEDSDEARIKRVVRWVRT